MALSWASITGADNHQVLPQMERTREQRRGRHRQDHPCLKPAVKDIEKHNIKVIPRVYLDWDEKTGNEYWPADMKVHDYSSDQFRQRVPRLVQWLEQLDLIAEGLLELKAAGVVVLWRPFQEMNGGWFWWGGPEALAWQEVHIGGHHELRQVLAEVRVL
jgi:hypothetical protein